MVFIIFVTFVTIPLCFYLSVAKMFPLKHLNNKQENHKLKKITFYYRINLFNTEKKNVKFLK